MAWVRGADEEVVGGVDPRGQREEPLRVAVRQLARGNALAVRGLGHRLAVLVGAREEEDLVPALAHVPRQDVRRDRGVRVAEVRLGVHVVDRRGDVVGHVAMLSVGGEGPKSVRTSRADARGRPRRVATTTMATHAANQPRSRELSGAAASPVRARAAWGAGGRAAFVRGKGPGEGSGEVPRRGVDWWVRSVASESERPERDAMTSPFGRSPRVGPGSRGAAGAEGAVSDGAPAAGAAGAACPGAGPGAGA
jgi:hypothetical protein